MREEWAQSESYSIGPPVEFRGVLRAGVVGVTPPTKSRAAGFYSLLGTGGLLELPFPLYSIREPFCARPCLGNKQGSHGLVPMRDTSLLLLCAGLRP